MDQTQVSKIAWYSVALMALTSIHHAYGAVIYQTLWRLHVLMISVPVIVLTLIFNKILQKQNSSMRSFAFWLFILITLVPSIGMIGVFEGVYNHVLKNILFFDGANEITL